MLTQQEPYNLAIPSLDKELEAVELFEQKRWGSAPHCPYCGSTSLSKRRKDMRFKCLSCKKSGSVTVNTHLHDTRLPLHVWLRAFTHTANSGKVPTATFLQKDLNISYKSALRMHNKITELVESSIDNVLRSISLENIVTNAMKQPVHSHEQVLVVV
jgi:transposase-like protein